MQWTRQFQAAKSIITSRVVCRNLESQNSVREKIHWKGNDILTRLRAALNFHVLLHNDGLLANGCLLVACRYRPHAAEEVYVTGTFDGWTKSEQLEKVGDVFQKTVRIPDASEKIWYKVGGLVVPFSVLPCRSPRFPPPLRCLGPVAMGEWTMGPYSQTGRVSPLLFCLL